MVKETQENFQNKACLEFWTKVGPIFVSKDLLVRHFWTELQSGIPANTFSTKIFRSQWKSFKKFGKTIKKKWAAPDLT